MSETKSFLTILLQKWNLAKSGIFAGDKKDFSKKLILVLLGWGVLSAILVFVLPQISPEIPSSQKVTQPQTSEASLEERSSTTNSKNSDSSKQNTYKILGLKRSKEGKPYSQIFTRFPQNQNHSKNPKEQESYTIGNPQGKIYKIDFKQEGKLCGESSGITQILNDRTFVIFPKEGGSSCKETYEVFYELPAQSQF